MSSKYLKQLNNLIEVANMLTSCANEKCKETSETIKNNKIIYNEMNAIMMIGDNKKKEELISKLASNTNIIKNDICNFNKCRKIYIKLIKVLIQFFNKIPLDYKYKIYNPSVKEALIVIKQLLKQKSLNQDELNEIHKNKNILFMSIVNSKTGITYN